VLRFLSSLAILLVLTGAPLFAIEIIPSQQAKLILSILEHTQIRQNSLRVFVAPSDSSHSKNLIRHLRKTLHLTIQGRKISLEVWPLQSSTPKNGDVVILVEPKQEVVPGVFCMSFDGQHVDDGAIIGILTEKDRVVLYLNPESAKRVGVKFQMELVSVARLKGGKRL